MNFGGADLAIGQAYRALTHVRRFRSAIFDPRTTQMEKLLKIIRANQDTAFGRAHKFDQIQNIDDYRKYVPASNYEYFQPYIDALKVGAKQQLTKEEPIMFATTSGTTASPKFIPITPSHLVDYTHAFHVHNYHMVRDFPQAAIGRFLIITSNDVEGYTESGLPYGAVSGLLNRRQSPLLRRHFAIPYEMCKIKDVDTKYYLMLRLAAAQDVTAVVGCNPSSLLLLADQFREHADEIVKDIYEGTCSVLSSVPVELRQAFEPYLKADKARSRQIVKALEKAVDPTPLDLWPKISVLSCWKGGPLAFYLERLPKLYGQAAVRDLGYMASEGRGTIPLSDHGAGGVLAVTSHFFEFVPQDDIDSPNRRFYTADELVLNERYYIFFTTEAGLYRYNINDIVQVVAFESNTPVIQFVRKGGGVSSITGEKLTEEQVLTALTQAKRLLDLKQIEHFTAEVELGYPPFYVCFAESVESFSDSISKEFIRIFDHSLKAQNSEYSDKRLTKRLGQPVLRLLPSGTYTRLRQQRVSEGAPEAQVKIPLLSPSATSSFSERLAALHIAR